MKTRTIILLSGGLDSTVILAACVKDGNECLAIGFDYDQPHVIELDRAEEIADHYGVPFQRIGLPAMFNAKVDDVVYAGRNLVFASLAVAIAQARGFDRIAIGCNASDWVRFPDCRPQFWRDVATAAKVYGVHVTAPMVYFSKRDIVELARKLKVPIQITLSCYRPQSGEPCGECLACVTRNDALKSLEEV